MAAPAEEEPPRDPGTIITAPLSGDPVVVESPTAATGIFFLKRLAVTASVGFALFISVRANKTIKNWVSLTFLLWFITSLVTDRIGVGFSVGVALLYSLVKVIQFGPCLLDLNKRIVANLNANGLFRGYRCELRRQSKTLNR